MPSKALNIPRTWLEAKAALALAGRTAGASYVVIARQLDGLVGPFTIGETVTVDDLLKRVAGAAGLELASEDGVPVLQPPADDTLKAALADITSDDATTRRRAAFALGESQRLPAIAPLMRAAADANRSVARTARLGLHALEGEFHVNQWPGRLSVFELPAVTLDTDLLMWLVEEGAEAAGREWQAAVALLGRARSGELARSLWWNLYQRRQGTIRQSIQALGRCGDRDARNVIESQLKTVSTNEQSDRFEAAAALGKLAEIRRLVECDPEHTPLPVRRAAAYGLGFCTSTESLDALDHCLADPDSQVAELAALALGRHGSKEALQRLARTLADQAAPCPVRAAAATALGRSGLPDAEPPLLAAAQTEDPAVRTAVAEALGDLGGPAAATTLEQLLEDTGRNVSAAAGRALAVLGSKNALPKLTAALTDDRTDLQVRIAIAIGLGQGRAPAARDALSTVALDDAADVRLRQYAARSLAMLADRAGQDTLRSFLEGEPPLQLRLVALRHLDLGDPDQTVEVLTWWATHGKPRHEQATAYERIGAIGTPEGVRFLAGGYETYDNYTRWTCIWPLVHNESTITSRALIDLLTASRRRTHRTNAAIALGGPGHAAAFPPDPDAIDALIAASEDPAQSVRIAAVDSLGLLDDPSSAPTLLKVLQNDESDRVAHHALRALRGRDISALPDVRAALDRARRGRRDCGTVAASTAASALIDQPANSFVLRRFARDYEDHSIPNLTYETGLCADDAGRIVQWGAHGRRYDAPQTGLTWLFDVKTNTWRRPTPAQEPPGVCMTNGIAFDTNRSLAITTKSATGMGGHGYIMYLRKFASFSVPWVFDAATEQWYPMRPVQHPGPKGHLHFDTRNDVMLCLKSSLQVYDPHANAWTALDPPGSQPGATDAAAYDPVAGRLILLSGTDPHGRTRTWAYDLRKNTWTDLKPQNPPASLDSARMVYDRANGVMLAFLRAGGRTNVYAYHPRENRWEALPPTSPSPDYALFDAAYDPVNNVTVICGGEDASCSGEPGVRETWTYRYKPADGLAPAGPPSALRLDITEERTVSLSWQPPTGECRGFNLYRGTGEHPWTAEFVKLNREPVADTTFPDPDVPGDTLHYYQVRAVGPDGVESLPSNLARTQPAPVREVHVARGPDGEVRLSWEPSAGPGVAGYHVYRAPVEPLDLWETHFDPKTAAGEFVKLNAEPIAGTTFTDRPDDAADLVAGTRWAPLHAYIVRAVNALGIESGPSPATLSIPGPPGPVLVVQQEDGSSLVLSGASRSAPVAGYHLHRLDCYRGDACYRTRGAPQPGTAFVDDETWPTGDRRAYYVVPVDELGQLGVSSSPGWARHRP